jgi:hypothetical protein
MPRHLASRNAGFPLEPSLRRRPATARRNRRSSFEKIFYLLFPPDSSVGNKSG